MSRRELKTHDFSVLAKRLRVVSAYAHDPILTSGTQGSERELYELMNERALKDSSIQLFQQLTRFQLWLPARYKPELSYALEMTGVTLDETTTLNEFAQLIAFIERSQRSSSVDEVPL